MAGTPYTKIKVADALKALGKKLDSVTVQVATPTKVKDPETGVERPAFDVKKEPLALRHIISAKKWKNGEITITTIDGRRHPEKADTSRTDDEEEEVVA